MMVTRAATADGRPGRDLELDLEVGFRIEEYRWFEWNRKALGDAPLYEPGRFVAHPGDLLSHLYLEASPEAPLADRPYERLPRYSSDAGSALRAADRAGVFGNEGARISCSRAGMWHLAVARAGIALEDDCLPRLLSRAALRLLDQGPRNPSSL